MTQQMELSIQRQEVGEKVFRAIGESAPAFGMVGTLVGLAQMLSSMDDPTTIGRATAVALLTTLYGVLIIEAIVQIHERNNPTAVLEFLEAYHPEKQRHRRTGDAKSGGENRSRRGTDRPGGDGSQNRRAAD